MGEFGYQINMEGVKELVVKTSSIIEIIQITEALTNSGLEFETYDKFKESHLCTWKIYHRINKRHRINLISIDITIHEGQWCLEVSTCSNSNISKFSYELANSFYEIKLEDEIIKRSFNVFRFNIFNPERLIDFVKTVRETLDDFQKS